MQEPILQIFRPALFLSFIAICLGGCSKDLPDPETLVDVPTTFNIRLIEDLDTTGRSLSLEVSTIEFQSCLNQTIAFNQSQSYNAILLSLNEIIEPETCEEGNGPALATVIIPDLTNFSYEIQINLKNTIENRGMLLNQNDRYLLEMETENGFQVLNPELLKVPENVVWGSFAFRDEGMTTISQSFFQELENIVEVGTYNTGDYGHFYVISDQNVFILDESPADLSFRRNFLYDFEGDFSEITSLLESYRAMYGVDIYIQLMDDKGRTW